MRRSFILLSLTALLLTSSISAEKLVEISVAPQVQYLSGNSEYSMYIKQPFYDSTSTLVTYTIESLLEFPLNNVMAGLTFSLSPVVDKTRWFIDASFLIGLTDPGGKMKDTDWQGAEPYYSHTMVSYTESDVNHDMSQFDIEAGYRLFNFGRNTVFLMGGFRYQKFSQYIEGYEGWYRYIDETDFSISDMIPISDTLPAIDYELKLKQPKVGLAADLVFSELFTSTIKAAYAMSFFNDIDDHLIRTKRSTANGDGSGFIGDITLSRQLSSNPSGINKFIELNAGIMTVDIKGTQRQEWYDDEGYIDPVGDTLVVFVPKGTVITSIPHKIKSTQYHVSLRGGIKF